MARNKENRAFRKGLVLGGIAGAAILIWNAPQPGWRTREQIQETFEGMLFKVLDMPEKLRGESGAALQDVVVEPAAPEPAPVDPPVLSDIVIDGPRPAELSI
jgi:hypothetical protein